MNELLRQSIAAKHLSVRPPRAQRAVKHACARSGPRTQRFRYSCLPRHVHSRIGPARVRLCIRLVAPRDWSFTPLPSEGQPQVSADGCAFGPQASTRSRFAGALAFCVACLLCWQLIVPLPATAAAPVDAWELIHPKSFDWREVAHRQAVAKDLSRRLDLLASVVPPQSTEQRTHVFEELAKLDRLGPEASPRRRARLYISRGYQHLRLLELIGETRSDLDCILAAREIKIEMHCWSLAAQHFGDEARLDLALSMLRRARLIPKDEQMPVTAQDPEVWYGEYGRGILQHILIPYLADAAITPAQETPPDA